MIPPKVDVHSLMVFYFVAVEGSITAAAEKLYLTQPTVSYHIKTLENSVSVKLLNINRQKVSLIPAGTGLFEYAKEIYCNITNAETYLLSLKESLLRVGVSMIYSQVVANAATSFMEEFPEVKLVVRDAISLEVAEDVVNSKIDVGIVISTPFENPKLRIIPVSSAEKLVLVASPRNMITKRESAQLADLSNIPLVAGPVKSVLRSLVLKQFDEEGIDTPPVSAEVSTAEWGMSLVESGKCVGIYPERVVRQKILEGRLKALPLVKELKVGVDALIRTDSKIPLFVNEFVNRVIAGFSHSAVI